MSTTVAYRRHAEDPALELWWTNRAGALIDFSTGYTFTAKVAKKGATVAALTKSTGITGAAGSGTPDAGDPNVTIEWAAGDLDLTPGTYELILTATRSPSLDRIAVVGLHIEASP